MSKFVAKVTDNKVKHLRCYAVNLMNNLEPLQSYYLKKYNLASIVLIVRSLEQARVINEKSNNFSSAKQVQMMYTILDEEEICLYAMIKATLKRINTILKE